jgi:DNA-binding CsgD family transcriptional regulator/lambda repressor-like predicted transcriptional regulator
MRAPDAIAARGPGAQHVRYAVGMGKPSLLVRRRPKGRPGVAIGPAVRRRVLRLYKRGRLSSYAIADRLSLHPGTVARFVKQAGLTRPWGWANRPDPSLRVRDTEIARLYRGGLTAEQVARRLRLTESCVKQVLHRRGVPMRQAGSWNPNRPNADYHEVRAYAKRIAPKLGTGPGTSVRAFADRAGYVAATLLAHLHRLGHRDLPLGMGAAKITPAKAAAIKAALVKGETFAAIARRFRISDRTVSSIATGRTWRAVPWPNGVGYVRRRQRRRKGSRDGRR